MKAPWWWARRGVVALGLAPLGVVTGALTARRVARVGYDPGIRVICVGNATVGGSGKTVVALDFLRRLRGRPFGLTRGYGGRLRGPVLVDGEVHSAGDVGDEALLLAGVAPVVVARDRAAGAKLALAEGATAIVMDDGLQNGGLRKHVSVLVVDGGYGFGNYFRLPAGPLRERVEVAAQRCQAAVMIGQDVSGVAAALRAGLPILKARLLPVCGRDLAGVRVVAYAGIGRPEKFFASVRELGGVLAAAISFTDHYKYGDTDAERLLGLAEQRAAILVTTAKDFVKLPMLLRMSSTVITVTLDWEDEAAVDALVTVG